MNISDNELLQYLKENGIVNDSDISDIEFMKKKELVLNVHTSPIWQGQTDKRYFTWAKKDGEKRRRVAKQTEDELINYLYDYYFGGKESYKTCTLKDIYEEWIEYKLTTVNRANTVHRMETDYRRFYLEEPLSNKIMNTPLLSLTPADIKQWSYSLIKKYDMTRKSYANAVSILRQVYRYLMEREIIDKTPFSAVIIPPNAFKKARKQKADSQIFFEDEIMEIVKISTERAIETKDKAFLVFPFLYHTGMRIGECLALTDDDINREDHIISVNKMFAVIDERLEDGTWAKRHFEVVDFLKGNGEEREVLVTDECLHIIDMVKQLNKENHNESPRLFDGVSESNVQCKLYRLCQELEITKRSPHKWRKTYISNLLNRGVDPDFVREQVGHKDLRTTYGSYTFSTTKRDKQIRQLEDVLSL